MTVAVAGIGSDVGIGAVGEVEHTTMSLTLRLSC